LGVSRRFSRQQEPQGQQIFNTIGRCNVCHPGPRLTGDTFRYIGVRPQFEDLGRFNVTLAPGDRGRMKVPSLRNVELRAPYFHNGEMPTLEDVVDFYDRGGDFQAPNLDPAIAPIGLSPQQKTDLVAFLKRPLTDPRIVAQQPPFDHPALYAQSARVPAHYGAGTSGTGDFVPAIVAYDPPAVGNARFAIAVDHGNAGRDGILVPAQPRRGHAVLRRDVTQSGAIYLRIGAIAGNGAERFRVAQMPIPPTRCRRRYDAPVNALDATRAALATSEAVALTYS
jgi:hypothetical protein